MNLTLTDFISDYQHLIVKRANKKSVLKHIENYYNNIKTECLEYINNAPVVERHTR